MSTNDNDGTNGARRRLVNAGAAAAALAAIPGIGVRGAQAQGAFDWKDRR